ncbi:MAG: UDP-N-acetylmuramoyl-tripeptide--D-alanyl-D-alanine ligase [Flavobacteriales bacterium]
METIQDIYNKFMQSTGVCTDTRNIIRGSIFFALKGGNFDGNQFAQQALDEGCIYAVCDDSSLQNNDKIIIVDDALTALQQLASHHRSKMNRCKWISITGSNGKTTSKELLARVLSTQFDVVYTKGNLNNHIGVPLTILSIKNEPDFAIIEMGANHQGEIRDLMQIAKPNYGYITNFGLAHLEGMGGPEGVVKAKSEMYNFLRTHSCFAFVNGTDVRMLKQSEGISRYVFGEAENSNAKIKLLETNPFLKVSIIFKDRALTTQSSLVGEYNLSNILAAACIGSYFGISDSNISEAIAQFVPDNNRSQFIHSEFNDLILDAYNANPSSMEQAIKSFATMKSDKPKILILGAMMELGDEAAIHHQRILDLALPIDVEHVFTLGELYPDLPDEKYTHFTSIQSLIDHLSVNQLRGKLILIKGSRANQLERIKVLL